MPDIIIPPIAPKNPSPGRYAYSAPKPLIESYLSKSLRKVTKQNKYSEKTNSLMRTKSELGEIIDCFTPDPMKPDRDTQIDTQRLLFAIDKLNLNIDQFDDEYEILFLVQGLHNYYSGNNSLSQATGVKPQEVANETPSKNKNIELQHLLSEEDSKHASNELMASWSDRDKRLQNLLTNIQKYFFDPKMRGDHKIFLNTFQKALIRYRYLINEKYIDTHDKINSFKGVYDLTTSENLYRHAIAINAGLGTGSVVYGISTSILLNPLVMAVSGGISILLCGLIATYFLSSYTREDKEVSEELASNEEILHNLINTEARSRLRCYRIINITQQTINSTQALVEEGDNNIKTMDDFFPEKSNTKINPLFIIPNKGQGAFNTIASIDEYIDNESKNIRSTISAEETTAHVSTSIYERIFHSQHWGPILSFFGATGTLFGVTKSILFVVGITALAGTTSGLGLAILAGALTISLLISLEHWQFNKKSDARRHELKTFEKDDLHEQKKRVSKIDSFATLLEGKKDEVIYKSKEIEYEKNDPQMVKEVSRKIDKAASDLSKQAPTSCARTSEKGFFSSNASQDTAQSAKNNSTFDLPQKHEEDQAPLSPIAWAKT